MIVGSNERRFAWMDEGFNTYINAFSDERRTAGTSAWTGLVRNWRDIRARGISSPLMTPPDRIDRAALGAIAYRKPGAVMLTLRNHVVGRETFDAAFREYARRWAFRHPTPGDFFRTVEGYAGEDLSWFWRGFFYTDDVLDIGIEGVEMASADGAPIARVALRRHTSIPFPVTLRLRLEDGSTMDARLPVQIWAGCPCPAGAGGKDRHVAEIGVKGRVVGARLWPDPSVPDWNAENDAWGDAPPADRLGPVTLESGGGVKPD